MINGKSKTFWYITTCVYLNALKEEILYDIHACEIMTIRRWVEIFDKLNEAW